MKPPGCLPLATRPMTISKAKAFVTAVHRHHIAPQGALFAIGVGVPGETDPRGVAIIGRPTARMLDDGWTCEVTRLATDGTPNSCSLLYGASRRVAKTMGFRKIITYILASEPGDSLRAAGWTCEGEAGGGSWSVPSRPRVDKHPIEKKSRWSCRLA